MPQNKKAIHVLLWGDYELTTGALWHLARGTTAQGTMADGLAEWLGRFTAGIPMRRSSGEEVLVHFFVPATGAGLRSCFGNRDIREASDGIQKHARTIYATLPKIEGVILVVHSASAARALGEDLQEMRYALAAAGVAVEQLPFVFQFAAREAAGALSIEELCATFRASRVAYLESVSHRNRYQENIHELNQPLEALFQLIEGHEVSLEKTAREPTGYRETAALPDHQGRWMPSSPREFFERSTSWLTLDGRYEEDIRPSLARERLTLPSGALQITQISPRKVLAQLAIVPGRYQLDLAEREVLHGTALLRREVFAARLRLGQHTVAETSPLFDGSAPGAFLLAGPEGSSRKLIEGALKWWSPAAESFLPTLLWGTSIFALGQGDEAHVWTARNREGQIVEIGFHGHAGEVFLGRRPAAQRKAPV